MYHDIHELIEQAVNLIEHGKYSQALEFLEQAMERSEAVFGPNDTNTACIRFEIGICLYNLSKYRKSLFHFREAANTYESAASPDYDEIAHCYNRIGSTLMRLHKHKDAKKALQKAFEIMDRHFGPHYNTIIDCLNLGAMYMELENTKDAKNMYFKALKMMRDAEYDDNQQENLKAEVLYSIGVAFIEEDDYARSHMYLSEAAHIFKEEMSFNYKLQMACLSALGIAMCEMGMGERAVKVAKKALEMAQELGNEMNIESATLHYNIGYTLRRVGKERNAEALEWFNKAKFLNQTTPSPNLTRLINQEKACVLRGEKAEPFYKTVNDRSHEEETP